MAATKRRIRPVIEEIVETPSPAAHEPERREEHAHHHVHVEEVHNPEIETMHEVASYDEPPTVEPVKHHENPEAAAREFLGKDQIQSEPEHRTNMKLVFFVTILTALIVGFIAGGVYVYVTGVADNSDLTEVTPMPSPTGSTETTPTPTPSAKPVVKLDTLTVNVLNGSGIIGAAGKVKASLENGGFKVTGTGNAANYNFKNTVIQVKTGTSTEVIDALKKSLSDYVVEEGDALAVSSKFDIVVTAGKQ